MYRGNIRGAVFVSALVLCLLMVFLGITASNMILQDTHMIQHLKYSTQAQYLAEAGISDALAKLLRLGFFAKDNPGNFPKTDFGPGTYDVTVIENGDRVILSSEGEVNGVKRVVAIEIKDNTPTSLYYMMSAGSDLRVRTFLVGFADIHGDIHANRNTYLYAVIVSWIRVTQCPNLDCEGNVSASENVYTYEGFFGRIMIDGQVINGAPMVSFPNFDYAYYKTLAIAGGDYYSGTTTFGRLGSTTTLTPTNGIIYVDGRAKFRGTVHLYGGIVADDIRVIGQLYQHKTGTRNVIISRTGDIRIFNTLDTEMAVVYSGRDFRIASTWAVVDVNGTLIAARNIRLWDFIAFVTYNHYILYPDGLKLGTGGVPIEVVSWNR